MTRESATRRESGNEIMETFLVAAVFRDELGEGVLEPQAGENGGSTVACDDVGSVEK